MELTPFKVTKINQFPILHVVIESLNARNAHWVKDEILHFVSQEHPKGLLINLTNVKHMGHIGLGALIAINNQLRNLKPHAFVGMQAEVKDLVHKSHLESVFQIWSPADVLAQCPELKHMSEADLKKLFAEIPPQHIDESKIPHLGEKVEHKAIPSPRVIGPLDLDAPELIPNKGFNKVGIAAVSIVLIGITAVATWFAAQSYFTNGKMPLSNLGQEELLEKYDKNRDGTITASDVELMDPTERMNIRFSPMCKQLGMANCNDSGK